MALEAAAMAEVRRDEAEYFLSKDRVVTRLILAAQIELDEVHREIDRSFHSGRSVDEKREAGDRHRPRLEAFERALPGDPPTLAAWLALKGWLEHLSARPAEAAEQILRAKRADSDLALAWIVETMMLLSEFLPAHRLPSARYDETGLHIDGIAGEASEFERFLERIASALQGARGARILGEISRDDVPAFSVAIERWVEGDLDGAEAGFARALTLPEFAWFHTELLMARAKVRFLRGDYEGGIEDAERLLESCPEWAEAWVLAALLHHGQGVSKRKAGKDPIDSFTKARECRETALRLDPGGASIRDLKALKDLEDSKQGK
jgi:tetratricopeptide (TPR) repeat protein